MAIKEPKLPSKFLVNTGIAQQLKRLQKLTKPSKMSLNILHLLDQHIQLHHRAVEAAANTDNRIKSKLMRVSP